VGASTPRGEPFREERYSYQETRESETEP